MIALRSAWRTLKGGLRRLLPPPRRVSRIPDGPGAGLRFDPGAGNPAYASGSNERPVQDTLAKYLQDGAVFYDIGANVGFFTVIGARLVGQAGRVLAFEPVAANRRQLRRNLRLNRLRNVRISKLAVCDRCGEAEFCVTDYAGGSVLASADHRAPDVRRLTRVRTTTLDHLVGDCGWPAPSVVKIDVEGAEHEVLLGMRETLKRHRPVMIYEIDDTDQVHVDRKQGRCDRLLEGLGYRLARLADSYPDSRWTVTHTLALPG